MGTVANAMSSYFKDNCRFADLFNVSFFGGNQVVRVENLSEGAEVYNDDYLQKTIQEDNEGHLKKQTLLKSTNKIHDVRKWLDMGKGKRCLLRVLSVELQNFVDYTMPWRHMDYDALEYRQQIRDLKNRNDLEKNFVTHAEKLCGILKTDRLIPAYTICLYHGEAKWDGPRSLKDMMDFGEDGGTWANLFADYRMNLVCVNELTDFSKFRTSLKEFFMLLAYRSDKKKLIQMMNEDPAFKHLDKETVHTAGIVMGANRIMAKKNEGEETYDMCTALRELIEDGRNEGLQEGWNNGWNDGWNDGWNGGADALNELIRHLKKDGRLDDLFRSLDDREYQLQLMKEYGIPIVMK